jgi:hypothetical protein
MVEYSGNRWTHVCFTENAMFVVVQVHRDDAFPDEVVVTMVGLETGTPFKFKSTSDTLDASCEVFCSGEYQL